ncbi:MAG: hypothetical protein HYZ21_00085, partial [Chloroflexi bacterium]|nr:hypothetical protein [Chloroflexota bacterium]
MSEFLVIIKTPITSLLSALVIYVFYLQAEKRGSIDKWIKTKALIYVVAFLLIVLLLPVVLYFVGLFPRYWFYAYTHEFVISMMVVLPLVILWGIMNKAFHSLQSLLLSSRLERLSLIEKLDLKGETWVTLEQNSSIDEQIIQSLKKWIRQRDIQTTLSRKDLLDFFSDEYLHLRKVVNESILNDCLIVFRLGIEHPPTERDIVLYDLDDDEEFRCISLDDHIDPNPFNGILKQDDEISLSFFE